MQERSILWRRYICSGDLRQSSVVLNYVSPEILLEVLAWVEEGCIIRAEQEASDRYFRRRKGVYHVTQTISNFLQLSSSLQAQDVNSTDTILDIYHTGLRIATGHKAPKKDLLLSPRELDSLSSKFCCVARTIELMQRS